ncbi:MFS transporter [Synechococcus sp. 1G10]|uniref:MFS transporter n=1 Tax=Synechococcus sp. 1G10 TaxID=2025605 RepID=UPI000B9981D6|nr:MFS transporter [Synechococcus sp. 1G10]
MADISPQQALEQLAAQAPFRGRHLRLFLISIGGTFMDGYATLMTGVALPLFKLREDPDPVQVGLLGAALVLGAVVGAILGGHLGDRRGRRFVYRLDMAILAVAFLLLAVAWNPLSAIAFQLLVGLGIGMDFPVSSAYVSELMPARLRTRLLTATISFQAVGELVGAATAWLLLQRWPEPQSWRWLLGSGAAFALLLLLARLGMPESPHWLMEQGRNREAAQIIASLSDQPRESVLALGRQAGEQLEAAPGATASGATATTASGWGLLFTGAYRRTTALTAGSWFLMDIATYGVGLFTPIILAALLGSPAGPAGAGRSVIASEFSTISGTALVDSFLLLGFGLGIVLVPRFGPIRMQSIGFLGMAAGMAILAFGSLLPEANAHRIGLVFLGFIVFNLLMNAGPNSTTFLLPAHLYPTSVRATGAGFAAATGKVGATLGIFLLPIVRERAGITTVLVLMVAVSLLAWFVTVLFSRHLPRGTGSLATTLTPT